MALPKINSSPKYEMTIPSTGETVRFRPFLIKEEKSMLIAAESGETNIILKSIVDTLEACIDKDIKMYELATFDIEYMFLQLRSKSVGETTSVGITCPSCKNSNELKVNINEIELNLPESTNDTIKLTDDISVELGYPTFGDISNSGIDTDNMSGVENLFNMIQYCFKTVITEEEKFNLKDHSREEITAFVESLDSKQFNNVRNWIEKIPKLQKDFEFNCTECNHMIKDKLEGMTSFLY